MTQPMTGCLQAPRNPCVKATCRLKAPRADVSIVLAVSLLDSSRRAGWALLAVFAGSGSTGPDAIFLLLVGPSKSDTNQYLGNINAQISRRRASVVPTAGFDFLHDDLPLAPIFATCRR
eukprot:TRINITY_DN36542_c0_g1_i3.p1 TRINITY_DN36542_c0_g1~~TRINITY_DN36542_c0_g1_i3.p1  ORF type:complete len:119 (+),score=3.67 TRINITY_DN36542_c0_g1_i3:189-545(+)